MKNKVVVSTIVLCLSLNMYGTMRFLVCGGQTGWIGKKIVTILSDKGYMVEGTQVRLEDRTALQQEIDRVNPDCIINAAGVIGVPNVDWCEDNKQAALRSNIIGALNLFDVAYLNNIYVINLGTGYLYEYDDAHKCNSGRGFTEDDAPNFFGSFYSFTKGMLDRLILSYPNVLNLRLRMPISDDLHPKSLVTKITKYSKVINIPNSMTILHDLLPLIPDMAERKLVGNLNFVNPGAISHNEVLDLYKKYIDPDFVYQNFTVEEQDRILKARRSNNCLDTEKLLHLFPNVPEVHTAMEQVFVRMRDGLS